MKAETARPPAKNKEQQQARFDIFRRVYNEDRPHEALGQKTPASLWRLPIRAMPDRLTEAWYNPDHEVRSVEGNGIITWRGKTVFISEALACEKVALIEHECAGYLVKFHDRDLGIIDCAHRFYRFAPPHARLRCSIKSETVKESQCQECCRFNLSAMFPVVHIHIVPDFVSRLRSGHLLPIGNTRYILVEPFHHVAPVQLEKLFFDIPRCQLCADTYASRTVEMD